MADITSNLVSHWIMDETGTSTTCTDSGSLGNDVIATGYTALSTSRSGGVGLDFDGSNDYCKLDGALADYDNYTHVTIAAWIRRDLTTSTWQWIAGCSDDLGLYIDSTDAIVMYIYNGSTWKASSDVTADIDDAEWHHVAGSWSNTTDSFRIYLDGEYLRTTSASGSSISYTSGINDDVQIGAMNAGSLFHGRIADIRWYSRVLADADVTELYENPPQEVDLNLSSLAAEWVFDEATSGTSATTVYDSEGNADLTAEFTGNGAWETNGYGAGIGYTNTTHGNRIGLDNVASNASDLATALGDACQQMTGVFVVEDIQGASDWQRLIQYGGDATNGDFTITIDQNDKVIDVRYGEDTPTLNEGIRIEYINTTLTGGPHVVIMVVDSTESSISNRIRFYKNGVLQTNTRTDYSGSNAANTAPDFNRSTANLALMNRPDGGHSLQGSIYYAALFDSTLNQQTIDQLTLNLRTDNDSPISGVNEYTIVGTTDVNVNNTASLSYATTLNATFLAEWVLDEASSGTTPTIAYDSVGDVDLAITYTGSGAWTSNAAGNGIDYPNTTHTGKLIENDIANGNALGNALGSACQKMSAVVRVGNTLGTSSVNHIMSLYSAGSGEFALCVDQNGRIHIKFDQTLGWDVGYWWSYNSDLRTGGPYTVGVSIDTTQATSINRIKVYVNGSEVSRYAANSSGAQNDAVDFTITTDNISCHLMNSQDGGRPVDGTLYYAAILEGAVSATDMGTLHSLLTDDNDTPLGVPTGTDHTPISGIVDVNVDNSATLIYVEAISNEIVGDVSLNVVNSATLLYTNEEYIVGEIDGIVDVNVDNSALLEHARNYAIIGSVAVTIDNAATLEYNIHPDIVGNADVNVVNSADLLYTDEPNEVGSIAGLVHIDPANLADLDYTEFGKYSITSYTEIGAGNSALLEHVPSNNYTIDGYVTPAVTNSATLTYENVEYIVGTINGWVQAVAGSSATLEYENVPLVVGTIEGDVVIPCASVATLEYTLDATLSGSTNTRVTNSAVLEQSEHSDIVSTISISTNSFATMAYGSWQPPQVVQSYDDIEWEENATRTFLLGFPYWETNDTSGPMTFNITHATIPGTTFQDTLGKLSGAPIGVASYVGTIEATNDAGTSISNSFIIDIIEDVVANSPFIWVPDRNYVRKPNPRVLAADYNNGYSVRAPNGVNNFDDTWALTFNNRNIGQIRAIEGYLRDRKGSAGFLWAPIDVGTAFKVTCDTWSSTLINNYHGSLTAMFKRVYI